MTASRCRPQHLPLPASLNQVVVISGRRCTSFYRYRPVETGGRNGVSVEVIDRYDEESDPAEIFLILTGIHYNLFCQCYGPLPDGLYICPEPRIRQHHSHTTIWPRGWFAK
jgi:hypothetical protein